MKTIVCGRWNKHSSSRSEARAFWSARNQYDAGTVERHVLARAEKALTQKLVRELESAGVDFIGDGEFGWDSIFDHARVLTGADGFVQLTRIPETNHFHRQWTQEDGSCCFVKGGQAILCDLEFVRSLTNKPIVLSIPGPYSMACQVQNLEERGLCSLVLAYADALNEQIKTLLHAGAQLVRIEDPQILSHPEDWEIFRRAMNILTDGLDQSKLILATWYGDVGALSGYFDLPFGNFWLDFVEGRDGNLEALKNFPRDKKLVAGLFDARHTYEETDEEVTAKLRQIVDYVPEDCVMISTNTDLHFLPWDEALMKVRNMVAFAHQWKSSPYLPAKNSIVREPVLLEPIRTKIVEVPSLDVAHTLWSGLAYPTSTVGSFPQPQELRKARVALRRGEINETVYKQLIEKHTRNWMAFQEELDITNPVSGEFGREDMAAFYGLQFGGKLLDFVPSYENRRYRPVEYSEGLRLHTGATVPDFQFVQSLTQRPVKETITGPATLADWALIRDKLYYQDRRRFRMSLANGLRQEVEALIKAGVRVLQVDEPALTTKMRNYEMDVEAIYEVIRGFEQDIYLILHICYSDMEALDKAFLKMLELPFHQIHMEMANRNYSLLRLIEKYGFSGKDIGLGVTDVHTDRVETVEEIVQGVERVRPYFRPEQIWLTPDCGLKERSDEVARAKLRVMVEAAKVCREKLG